MTPAYESATLSVAAVIGFAIWLGVPPIVHWLRNGRRAMRHIQQLAEADRDKPLGQLVKFPEHDRHRAHRAATSEHQSCHRCRTGSLAWPCTCGHDCYSPVCQGWYADTARTVIKGDQ